jgi:hypothetical protein
MQPGEIILWRGRPDPWVIFAPQDIVLVPFSLIWTGFFVFFARSQVNGGSLFSAIYAIPFLVVGSYIVLLRFFVKWWARHRQRYAITNLRAVEVKRHGRSVREAPVGSTVEIRLRKGGRHATAIWPIAPKATRTSRFATIFLPAATGDLLRGTGWPGEGSTTALELDFNDVADVDGLTMFAKRAGFAVHERTDKSWLIGLGSLPARPQTPVPAARHATGKIRAWVDTRMLRHPYQLWTPLDAYQTASKLFQNLAPLRQFSLGAPSPTSRVQGSVSGWSVRLVAVGQMRNSWRYEFIGGITVNGPGCWLTGTVGPPGSIPGFSAAWFGFVSLFFIAGSIGFLSDAVTGHGFGLLPFVLIPGFMLIFFVVLTELAARFAAKEWERTEQWLRLLLDVPENPLT